MARTKTGRKAPSGTASYAAGEYLHKHGPLTERQLFAAIPFGNKTTCEADMLQRAIVAGWLKPTADGKIGLSAHAREHYDRLAGEAARPVGQIAALREPADVFARPPLSKKFIPNPRGSRPDVPEWSIRTGATFHTKA